MQKWIRTVVVFAGIAWAGGLALGLYRLGAYENEAGASGTAADRWPADAPPINHNGFTIAVFLHPECPCSKATLSSLDHIMAHGNGKLHVYAFPVIPPDAPAGWRSSELIASAENIPGVTVITDEGHFAEEFGALTSGQIELFDSAGKRVFSGGITAGRGHEGDNAGMDAVESIILGHSRSAAGTPVFGCALAGRCNSPGPKE